MIKIKNSIKLIKEFKNIKCAICRNRLNPVIPYIIVENKVEQMDINSNSIKYIGGISDLYFHLDCWENNIGKILNIKLLKTNISLSRLKDDSYYYLDPKNKI